ncbi:Spore germination protein YndE [compost metagenome]
MAVSMESTKIKPMQFFSLLVLFQLGTALVVNLGIQSGRDAWIAILAGMLIGLVLFAVYCILYKLFPNMLPTSYSKVLLGKYVGTFINIAYVVFFMNKASRDLLDGGLLIISSTLKETPLPIVNLMMVLTVAYVLHKGIEVMARTATIFLAIILMLGFLIGIVILFSDIIEMGRLLPVLGDGVMPVFDSIIKQNYQFPFAEVICFKMVMPSLGDPKKGIRAGYMAVLLSGLILSGTAMVTISALGVDIAERSSFPLLTMVGKAAISDFIQRTDILVVMVLIIGDFFKISMFYYAAVIGMSDLYKVPYRKLLYPTAIIILLFSILIARNYSEHVMKGGRALYFIDPIFFIAIPLILIIAATVYRFRSRSRTGA